MTRRYICLVYARPVATAHPLHVRTVALDADAPDTAGIQAMGLHDAARALLHGTAIERLPAWSVTVLPALTEHQEVA
jgi:hypothetical protein